MFFFLYVISFFFVLGGETWFLIWLGLELNMISFISMIYDRSLMGVEGCMKYFFVQSIGSGVLLGAFYFEHLFMVDMVSAVLVYKMGGGPFYFWFPSLCGVISWESCFFLMTFQKIIPLMLMTFFMGGIVWIMMLISMVVGVMGAFNEVNLKKLMSYSSIHHIGWILMCNYLGFVYWILYLLSYIIMMMLIVLILCGEERLMVSDLVLVKNKWALVFGFLNMGGMPPFYGFFLKWWVFNFMSVVFSVYMYIMIVMSVYMLYIYSRVVYSILLDVKSFSMEVRVFSNELGLVESILLFSMVVGPALFLF